jgi:hypothetical protein
MGCGLGERWMGTNVQGRPLRLISRGLHGLPSIGDYLISAHHATANRVSHLLGKKLTSTG